MYWTGICRINFDENGDVRKPRRTIRNSRFEIRELKFNILIKQ